MMLQMIYKALFSHTSLALGMFFLYMNVGYEGAGLTVEQFLVGGGCLAAMACVIAIRDLLDFVPWLFGRMGAKSNGAK